MDGVPRTLPQARMLKQHFQIDVVLNLSMNQDILVEILMGRRTCPCCNRSYHLAHIDRDGYEMPPILPKKTANTCDDCSVELVIRKDDTSGPIMERHRIYSDLTEPILEFYRNESETKVIDFEPKKGIRDFHLVKSLLEPHIVPTLEGEPAANP